MRSCRAFSTGSKKRVASSSDVGVGDEDASGGTVILGDATLSGRCRRLVLSSVLLLERSSLRCGLSGAFLLTGTDPRGVEDPGKGRRASLGFGGVGGEREFPFSASLPLLFFIRRVSLGRGEAYSSLRLSRSWSGCRDLYGDLEGRPRPCFLLAVSIASSDGILIRVWFGGYSLL